MNLEHIKQELHSPAYDFLRNDEHLGSNVILLALGGSHAYGLNTKDSDLDCRGIAINTKEEILLGKDFEQVINTETDTTIYSLNKMIELLLNMNPNTCEILGLKPEHYLYISPIGQEFLNHTDLFISKRCIGSFNVYAEKQLYRLKQATKGLKDQSELEKHILNTMNNMMIHFHEKYTPFPEDAINLYIDKSEHEDFDTEIFMDINLSGYPLRDYKSMWSEMHSCVKAYNKIGKRNKHAIEKGKISKHMYNLLRLPYMCIDILQGNGIITYREKEHDVLMDIRENKWLNEEGMPIPEFFELVDDVMLQVKEAAENTSLPDVPDYKKINEFKMSVNERIVRGCL